MLHSLPNNTTGIEIDMKNPYSVEPMMLSLNHEGTTLEEILEPVENKSDKILVSALYKAVSDLNKVKYGLFSFIVSSLAKAPGAAISNSRTTEYLLHTLDSTVSVAIAMGILTNFNPDEIISTADLDDDLKQAVSEIKEEIKKAA